MNRRDLLKLLPAVGVLPFVGGRDKSPVTIEVKQGSPIIHAADSEAERSRAANETYWDDSNLQQRIQDRDELLHWRDRGYVMVTSPPPAAICSGGSGFPGWVNIPGELIHARRWARQQGFDV